MASPWCEMRECMENQEKKTVKDQQYPDYFPEGCPPEDAHTDEQTLFRFCHETIPQKTDFESYYKKNPEKYKDSILAHGLSVLKSKEDCCSAIRKFPWVRNYQSVAKGITNEQRGSWKETPSRQNPAHITWWVCKDIDPFSFFEFEMLVGEE